MRYGDMRCAWIAIALAAGCERAPSPPARVTQGSHAAEPAGTVAAAREPRCAEGFWPLVDGDRWRWALTRTWIDERGAVREQAYDRVARVRAVADGPAAGRFVVEGWPRPWRDEPTETIAVARRGEVMLRGEVTDAQLAPWFALTGEVTDAPAIRTVTAGEGVQPVVLELRWPSMADDLTLRLACGQGPVAFEYHHHGTREELTAIRVAP